MGRGKYGAGRTALVTGATQGIGLALCQVLASDGYNLVLVARTKGALEEAARELEAAHSIKTTALAYDLSLDSAPQDIVADLEREGIVIDCLCNNAGFGGQKPFLDLPLDYQLRSIDVNVKAYVALAHLLIPGMKERGHGHVLNISSVAGFTDGPFFATYVATKHFLNSWSQSIAWELRKTGVKVTAYCPPATKTGWLDHEHTRHQTSSPLWKLLPVATAKSVAEGAYKAMKRGRTLRIHGIFFRVLMAGAPFIPKFISYRITAWTVHGRV